jgi:MFS family permease
MASAASAPPTPGNLKRIVAASLIGTTIEWYDFFLYGSAAALVFNKLFFPDSDPLVGTLLSFLTYAVGFAARPLGALVFGHYGDRLGRKKLLVLSLLMMGGATFAIGLLPTHATVGTAAPVLLTVLRLVQGFALGGEWGGAVLLVSEHGDARRRGFWASWPQTGAPAGQLLATGVLSLLTADTLPAVRRPGHGRSVDPSVRRRIPRLQAGVGAGGGAQGGRRAASAGRRAAAPLA